MEKGKQGEFLDKVRTQTNLTWLEIANICKVCDRTVRDWHREKYLISYRGLKNLHKVARATIAESIKVLPEHWNSKKAGSAGAVRRNEIYGNPGTREGRARGGKTTQKKFSLNPKYAKKVGFILRKEIYYPAKSSALAEFIGVVLGDGSISEHQVAISMNSKVDIQYGNFVKRLIMRLFKINPYVKIREKNTLQIITTGKNLVEFLLKCGLKKGDKVAQQVNVPKWIAKDKNFRISCLRGLMDTDGGVYFHTHFTKGIKYKHIGMCFTNKSIPLLNFVYEVLVSAGISAYNNKKSHVSIYGKEEIKKYMDLVGSKNEKNVARFYSYKSSKVFS